MIDDEIQFLVNLSARIAKIREQVREIIDLLPEVPEEEEPLE